MPRVWVAHPCKSVTAFQSLLYAQAVHTQLSASYVETYRRWMTGCPVSKVEVPRGVGVGGGGGVSGENDLGEAIGTNEIPRLEGLGCLCCKWASEQNCIRMPTFLNCQTTSKRELEISRNKVAMTETFS